MEKARSSDGAASALFDRAGQRLGAAVANIVNIFNPPLVIIIGARAVYADSVFFKSMERGLERFQLISDLPSPPRHSGEGGPVRRAGCTAVAPASGGAQSMINKLMFDRDFIINRLQARQAHLQTCRATPFVKVFRC